MKPARIAIAFAGAAALVLAGAGPASAVEETVGSCVVETLEHEGIENVEAVIEAGHSDAANEADKDALKELEEELEGCLEAPSPIIPEINEVIWGGLAFFVLLGAMIRWGFPAVSATMQGRTERIRSDLEAAEQAHAEAAQAKQDQLAQIAEDKANASKIIDEARQEAAVVKADLQSRAEAEIAEMRQRADADVAAARERALADLQTEVNEIVVGAAGRVVEQNLDVNTQKQLIDNYIASVGGQ